MYGNILRLQAFAVVSLICLTTFGCSVQAQYVHGSVSERSWAGEWLYLKQIKGSKSYLVDSAQINEKLYFRFPKNGYELGFYSLNKDKKNKVDLILNPAESEVLLHFEDKYLASSMLVRASNENILLADYYAVDEHAKRLLSNYDHKWAGANLKERSNYQMKADSTIKARNSFLESAKTNYPDSFFSLFAHSKQEAIYHQAIAGGETEQQFKRSHYFDYTNFDDERLINSRIFSDRIRSFLKDEQCTPKTEQGYMESLDYVMAIVEESGNDPVKEFVLNYLLGQFNSYGPMFLFEFMVENYVLDGSCSDLSIDDVYQRKAEEYESLHPGNKAPNFVIEDSNAKMIDIASTVANSKGTIVFFWSSHCHFCKSELPELFNLYNSYWDKGLTLIAVSMDENRDAWIQAINHYNMNWVNVCDLQSWKSQAARLYKVHKTPVYYFLSPDMEILAKPKKVAELKPAVDAVFAP